MTAKYISTLFITISFIIASASSVQAQSLDSGSGAVDVSDDSGTRNEAPPARVQQDYTPQVGHEVGRKAAAKYMGHRGLASSSSVPKPGPNTHYMAVHVGTFVSDNEYGWGSKANDSNVGRMNIGVTYRMGEWVNSMDLAVRVDYESFALADGSANKLSFLPVLMFPDATSKFPLYFGAGAGPGFFINQVNKQSPLSLDYQLFVGARFFNVWDRTGFFVEAGVKNHFLLLSSGQYNGDFVAAGCVFTF